MRRHPDWLKVRIGSGSNFSKVKSILRNAKLHTICEEARCPNISECFSRGTAVFLIMGNVCSRNCLYCNVKHDKPSDLNPSEPDDIAQSIKKLSLNYVVITSVTRDDLKDGGASFFYRVVKKIRKLNPNCKIEVLIPDFKGFIDSIQKIVESKPDVINHNIEVVENLYPILRPEGNYDTSLSVLKNVKEFNPNIKTKSGFMVGLGENRNQIYKTMRDLLDSNVDFLTIGQYLQPSKNHIEIKRYYTPNEFSELKQKGLSLGFAHVESGPLVRSSYHADEALNNN
jgi:lipoic acid synthetase